MRRNEIEKLSAAVASIPVIITFEFFGPTFGWCVSINGTRHFRFMEENGRWEAQYFKLPAWITSDDIDALRDIFLAALDKHEGYPKLRVAKRAP